MQARISATKGGGKASAGAKPAPTSASPPAEKPGVVQTQPKFESMSARTSAAGLSSPFATPVEGGGLFSNSPSFLDGRGEGDRTGEADDAAAWLEREKEQREQRERARREEEERWVESVKSSGGVAVALLCSVLLSFGDDYSGRCDTFVGTVFEQRGKRGRSKKAPRDCRNK